MRLPGVGPLVLACAASAQAATPTIELPSCVAGSPPLRLPATAARAALDAADSRHFQQAAEDAYPLYRRGGGAPAQVVLLQREGRWQYAVLWPGGPTRLCLAATFDGERFAFTRDWVARYRPREGGAAD